MRIAITTTQVPFQTGGAEIHATALKEALVRAGHQAEIISIPFKWYPPEKIMDHLFACRLLDLTESNGNRIDKVIGLKFPAYHIRHPNKTLWILHQFREAFDLWGTEKCGLMHYPNGQEIKSTIHRIEKDLLPEANSIFANSQNVAKRLKIYSDIESTPLYHPPYQAESFHNKGFEDYFFFPSRVGPMKRQELAIKALQQTQEPVKLVFSGSFESPEYEQKLKRLAKDTNTDDRIVWLGQITHRELCDTYARASAVVYLPYDEDYGYVTLEGMLSEKPVITCRDSGGPLEFIEHLKNGLVTESDPSELAQAFDHLWKERKLAKSLGKSGKDVYQAMNISWKQVIDCLLTDNNA